MSKMHLASALAVSLLIASPAVAQKTLYPRAAGPATTSYLHKPIEPAIAAQDVAALNAGSQAALFAMRAGYLATTKASATATRDIGQALISYHTQGLSDLQSAAKAAAIRLPALKLNPDQTARLAALEAASGPVFDRLFLAEVTASNDAAAKALLAHGKSKGNLIVVAQANRQGNQITALNAKIAKMLAS